MNNVPWWSPYVAAGVTALLVGGFSIVTTRMNARVTRSAARERAVEERRALLHGDRISAYREFRVAFRNYQVAASGAATLWGSRVSATRLLSATPGQGNEDAIRHFDSIDSQWRRASEGQAEQTRRLATSIDFLELVAGPAVRQSAKVMHGLAAEIQRIDIGLANAEQEDKMEWWTKRTSVEEILEASERALIEAIHDELAVSLAEQPSAASIAKD